MTRTICCTAWHRYEIFDFIGSRLLHKMALVSRLLSFVSVDCDVIFASSSECFQRTIDSPPPNSLSLCPNHHPFVPSSAIAK
jgi:hypothetical protein